MFERVNAFGMALRPFGWAVGREQMGLVMDIRGDIGAARSRDPAATSAIEVMLAYPGFHARQIHRLAHWLHGRHLSLLARLISHMGRALTGIEIHPGARLGEEAIH